MPVFHPRLPLLLGGLLQCGLGAVALAQTMPLATAPAQPAAAVTTLMPGGTPAPACARQLEQAQAADQQLGAAERQNQTLDALDGLTREAAQQWMQVQSQCEGALRDSAQRRLDQHLAGLARLAERQAAGRQCDQAGREAQSLQQ